MFTGIIEELGIVEKIKHRSNLCVLTVKAKKALRGVKVGDSICVSGVCLTVTAKGKHNVTFDIMKESVIRTTLKNLKPKSKVNLERALKVNDRLGGHFVTGHVDGVAQITKTITLPNYVEYQITKPKKLGRYLAAKGSVCVDGVSLTIGEVKKSYFSIYLIPHTLKVTTLGLKRTSDKVNIETDILAKYILANGGSAKRSS